MPRGSSIPACKPMFEKLWHGGPAVYKSTSPTRYSCPSCLFITISQTEVPLKSKFSVMTDIVFEATSDIKGGSMRQRKRRQRDGHGVQTCTIRCNYSLALTVAPRLLGRLGLCHHCAETGLGLCHHVAATRLRHSRRHKFQFALSLPLFDRRFNDVPIIHGNRVAS